jgi:hypothetical protein
MNQITRKTRTDFYELLKKTWSYSQKYDMHYPNDVRANFFIVFSELNLWVLIQCDSYLDILDRNTTRISRYMTLDPNSRIQFLAQYDTINRASYCTHAMFLIEDFLKVVGKKIGVKDIQNYAAFVKVFLKLIDMIDDKTLLILKSPAHIRNSLHNNGHTSYDCKLLIGNNEYEFKKGDQMYYSGWDNLYLLFDLLIDKVTEIVENPKVKSIEHIPHSFMTYTE